MQADERDQIEAQAQLLAFDRRNHAGASDALASNLQLAIREEAEELLSEKRVISGAINIRTNKEKMKVGYRWGLRARDSGEPSGRGDGDSRRVGAVLGVAPRNCAEGRDRTLRGLWIRCETLDEADAQLGAAKT